MSVLGFSLHFASDVNWWADFARSLAPVLAASIAALFAYNDYLRRRRASNRHVLFALWEESRLINLDCVQWDKGFNFEALQTKIRNNDKYRPYSVNFRSSAKAIEKLMSDMSGIPGDLVKAGTRYHYDDSNAATLIGFIGSTDWLQLDIHQKEASIRDANDAMVALMRSSAEFHMKLSKELRVKHATDLAQIGMKSNPAV